MHVVSLETILGSVPANVSVPFLKTDTQGYDLAIIKSASKGQLCRVAKIMSETYLPGVSRVRYRNVQNDLSMWVEHMRRSGTSCRTRPRMTLEEWSTTPFGCGCEVGHVPLVGRALRCHFAEVRSASQQQCSERP